MTDSSTAIGPAKQLELFEGRLPRKPYATDELGRRLLVTSRRRALRRRYLQVNPPWLRIVMVYDVDRPGGALAWEDADLPAPLWSAVNRENGHAHLAWALDAPVLLHLAARAHPMRYLAAVESLVTARLQADEGYAGLLTKNPLHPWWRVLWGPPRAWSLGELAEWLPGIERHWPKRGRASREVRGLGRNCDTFDAVRLYAYGAVRAWWAPPRERGVYVNWQAHLYAKARQYTADEHREPLHDRECHHIAKSVGLWVWRRFSVEGFRAYQAAAARKGGEKRRQATAGRDAQIRLLAEDGASQREIAALLGVRRGVVARALRRAPVVVEESSTAAGPDGDPDG